MNSLGFNKAEKDTKIIVAMSGGVDSSVAAVMLKKEGYDVTGVTLRLYNQPNASKSKSCCAGIDIDDAYKVAKQYDATVVWGHDPLSWKNWKKAPMFYYD